MTKILITGGSGFIGKNLILYLKEKNYPIKILYRNKKAYNYLKNFGETYYGDLEDVSALKELLKDVETIIHMAGSIRGNCYKDFYNGNVKITENLINLIKNNKNNVKKLIYISSLSAAGPSKSDKPLREEDGEYPVSLYGKSKLEAENLIKSSCPVPFIILRLTGVYGPEDKETFLFFKDAHRGTLILPFKKNQKIQLIFVKDVVSAIEKAISSLEGGIFFIAHPEILNTFEISFFLKEIVGKPVRIITIPEILVKFFAHINLLFGLISGKKTMFNPQKVKELLAERWICSTEKAKKILNFQAEYSFAQGAKEAYNWYKENKWL